MDFDSMITPLSLSVPTAMSHSKAKDSSTTIVIVRQTSTSTYVESMVNIGPVGSGAPVRLTIIPALTNDASSCTIYEGLSTTLYQPVPMMLPKPEVGTTPITNIVRDSMNFQWVTIPTGENRETVVLRRCPFVEARRNEVVVDEVVFEDIISSSNIFPMPEGAIYRNACTQVTIQPTSSNTMVPFISGCNVEIRPSTPPTKAPDAAVTVWNIISENDLVVEEVIPPVQTPGQLHTNLWQRNEKLPPAGKKSKRVNSLLEKEKLPVPPQISKIPPTNDTTSVGNAELSCNRMCIVCLKRKHFLEDIFEDVIIADLTQTPKLLKHVEELLPYLNISVTGSPKELGICPTCTDSLQQWHVFYRTIKQRSEVAKVSKVEEDNSSVNVKPVQVKTYKHYFKIKEVKEVYLASTHSYLARRHLTDKDWDLLCHYILSLPATQSNEDTNQFEKYIFDKEHLSQIHCIKCKYLVAGKEAYSKHLSHFHFNEPPLFPCDICGDQVKNYFEHWINHFFFEFCADCNERIPNSIALDAHFQQNHTKETEARGTDLNLINCDQCDASFRLKSKLLLHRQKSHSSSDLFMCTVCNLFFLTRVEFLKHNKQHKGNQNSEKARKVFKIREYLLCEHCGKYFSSKVHLMEHQSVHSDEKPFKCRICPVNFHFKVALAGHMKKHVRLQNDKKIIQGDPFECLLCNFRSHSVLAYEKHLETHRKASSFTTRRSKINIRHTPNKFTKPEKSYECPYCDISLSRKDVLNKHIDMHIKYATLADTSETQETETSFLSASADGVSDFPDSAIETDIETPVK